MTLVFVAGPYRAPTEWELVENIRRAELLALGAWQEGCSVICPHKNTAHFGGAAPDALWLDGALEQVRRSDVVLCTAGWERSDGAVGEVELARELGIPVFTSIEEMRRWLRSQE